MFPKGKAKLLMKSAAPIGALCAAAIAFAASIGHANTLFVSETAKQIQTCQPSQPCLTLTQGKSKVTVVAVFDVSGIPNFSDKMTSESHFTFSIGPDEVALTGFGRDLGEASGFQDGDTTAQYEANVSGGKGQYLLEWTDSELRITLTSKARFNPFSIGQFETADGVSTQTAYAKVRLLLPSTDTTREVLIPATFDVTAKTKTAKDGTTVTKKKFQITADGED
jgi:hypothetical protein